MSDAFFDETFWIVYQPLERNTDYSILDIFHYNSLNDRRYLEINQLTPNGCQLTFIPEKEIVGTDDKELLEIVYNNKEFLSKNKITFIRLTNESSLELQKPLLKIFKSANDFKL